MVTKMADKVGLKERNCYSGLNLRLLQTCFLRNRYQHKRILKKQSFDMLCVMIIVIICYNIFLVFACALF